MTLLSAGHPVVQHLATAPAPKSDMSFVPGLFGWDDPGAPFTAVIQLGTTLAVILYCGRELVQVVIAWLRGHVDKSVRGTLEHRKGWYLIVATIPVSIFGVAFSNQIETGARNLWVISVTVIALALVLALVVGLASIAWLIRWVSRYSRYVFICCRVAVGGLLIGLLGGGVISATST